MDGPTKRKRTSRNPDRRLLHLLNQRYHAEWVRAELLAQELAALKRSWLWRAVNVLRRVKHWFIPPQQSEPIPLAARYEGYALLVDVCQVTARISIIIPFRDQPELLGNCLRSLRAGSHRNFEVILVDNGSTEPRTRRLLKRLTRKTRYSAGIVSIWEGEAPAEPQQEARQEPRPPADRLDYRVIDAPGPFNFSKLCNLGASAATGEFLLFLNNDTEVLSHDWLEQMLAIAADPQVGAVGATLLYPDRSIQHAGLFPRTDGTWIHPYRGRPANAPGDEGELRFARSVPAVTAACLMIRREVFQAVGGFDERFPITMNDVDLCERLRERGLLVVVTPHARLLHYESLSRGYRQ